MDGQANFPPSCISPTQYNPTTPFGDGYGESFNRATMRPPRGSSLAPNPPPSQYGSQNFILYPESSSGVNKDTTYPPIPYSTPRKAHKRASSDHIVSGLNSLLAQNNHIHPKPIEMAVGVRSRKKNVGEDSSSQKDVNDGKRCAKRRAGNEIAPPSRTWRSVSFGSTLNGKSSVDDEETPPQGVSVDVEGDMFTASELSKIAADDKLKELVASDPKRVKRILANRKSAAHSKEKNAQLLASFKVQVETLRTQNYTLTAERELEKRERMAIDGECERLRKRLEGSEEQARLCGGLNVHLNREVHRLTEEASRQREEMSRLREELSEYRRRESEGMNANMLEQLNINQQFQENPHTNYNF